MTNSPLFRSRNKVKLEVVNRPLTGFHRDTHPDHRGHLLDDHGEFIAEAKKPHWREGVLLQR